MAWLGPTQDKSRSRTDSIFLDTVTKLLKRRLEEQDLSLEQRLKDLKISQNQGFKGLIERIDPIDQRYKDKKSAKMNEDPRIDRQSEGVPGQRGVR